MRPPKASGFVLLFGACIFVLAGCSKGGDADDHPAAKSDTTEAGSAPGVTLDAATQTRLGLKVGMPTSTQWEPEVTAYGVVMDPAALAGAYGDLAAADLAAAASDKEYNRQQILAEQHNVSARALEAAQTAALHDDLASTSEHAKFKAAWGPVLAERAREILSLITSNQAALVRMDLPAGENLSAPPLSAKILLATSETDPVSADFLDAMPGVDPQFQGQSYLFLLNGQSLPPNAAVSGFLKIPGEPLSGVMIPATAILRYEGRGWVYEQTGTNQFLRDEIPLDYPVTGGWFVPNRVPLTNGVVVTGAQTVLSAELSGGGFSTGERD
jgi:hypothetical protein